MKRFCSCLLFCILGGVGQAFAGLVFEKQNHEATSGVHEMKMKFEFPFVNKSEKAVEIKRVETSCTCLTASMPDNNFTIAAGAPGAVILEVDLGAFGGRIEKDAVVVTSEGERIPLKIVVKVPEFVKMEPRTLKWTVGEKPVPKTIRLIIHKDLDLKLEDVSISQKNFDFEPKTVKPGKEYAITVTPKSTATPEYAMLSVKTNSTEPRYKKCLGYLSISQKSASSK